MSINLSISIHGQSFESWFWTLLLHFCKLFVNLGRFVFQSQVSSLWNKCEMCVSVFARHLWIWICRTVVSCIWSRLIRRLSYLSCLTKLWFHKFRMDIIVGPSCPLWLAASCMLVLSHFDKISIFVLRRLSLTYYVLFRYFVNVLYECVVA